jgi:hypothetical protein
MGPAMFDLGCTNAIFVIANSFEICAENCTDFPETFLLELPNAPISGSSGRFSSGTFVSSRILATLSRAALSSAFSRDFSSASFCFSTAATISATSFSGSAAEQEVPLFSFSVSDFGFSSSFFSSS